MLSDTKVVNAALLKIGESPITSFTDEGKPALLANNTYTIHRDALMRAHEWSFAIKRTSLPASATAPDWEFDYSYPLPSEPNWCLRVLTVYNASDYDWRVEGRAILTDIGAPLHIRYIQRITDPNLWDALFAETLVAKLAAEWAESLTKEPELCTRLVKEYVAKLEQAQSIDGQEGKTEPLPSGSWVEAHRAS